MNWKKIEEQSAEFVKLNENLSNASQVHTRATNNYHAAKKQFARPLQAWVKRRAGKIVKALSRAWCVDVRVIPLTNGLDKTCCAHVEIDWTNGGTRIQMQSTVHDDSDVERLLNRFERTVAINGRWQEEAEAARAAVRVQAQMPMG